ncbi:MAG: DUF3592 domain-containing protein [Ruminococcus sp.]|nr:DUF3592 domain-containing protein [Ruminococcus sp.]
MDWGFWGIFWGCYILAFAIAMLIVAYALGWRSMCKERLCTAHTTGTVVRYSNVRYNGVRLPVVQYTADGQTYHTVGPRFKAGVVVYTTTPWAGGEAAQTSNLTTREDLPDVLVRKQRRSSFGNSRAELSKTSLHELYPVGSQANVCYDPDKPKRAYVERYVAPPAIFSFWIPFIGGILAAVGGIICLVSAFI